MAQTVRFTRRNLPHWEVEGGRYFVTVRCADSLPREAVLRLAELHGTLATITPRSPGFAAQQRETFRTLEKHLDAGAGACPLRDPTAAQIVVEELEALAEIGVSAPHFCVMPNHWHALILPPERNTPPIKELMRRLKGRTAKRIRRELGGTGPVWQREWFDRWLRNDAELERCVAYIRNNPVKAGLVRNWPEHPWTK